VRRREFITLFGGAAATWPLAARAQQPRKLPTIGFVGPSTATIDRPLTGPFAQRPAELGWADGRSIVIDYRPSEGLVERAGEIAAEFVRLKVDVIVTGGDAQALAAKRATAVIPIVFGAAENPRRRRSRRSSRRAADQIQPGYQIFYSFCDCDGGDIAAGDQTNTTMGHRGHGYRCIVAWRPDHLAGPAFCVLARLREDHCCLGPSHSA
jgi:hypothetical protein